MKLRIILTAAISTSALLAGSVVPAHADPLPAITITPDTIGPGESSDFHFDLAGQPQWFLCEYLGENLLSLPSVVDYTDTSLGYEWYTNFFGAPLTVHLGLIEFGGTCPEDYRNTLDYATWNLMGGLDDGSSSGSAKATIKFTPGSSSAIPSTLNNSIKKVGKNTDKVTLSALATKSTRALVRARLAEVKAAFIQRTGLTARKVATRMRVIAKVSTNVVEVRYHRGETAPIR